MEIGEVTKIDVEWLILADYAETVGSKLYLMGGGWDTVFVQSAFPVKHSCAIAIAFKVPWTETNQPHRVEIEIQNPDATPLAKVDGHFEIGRPPGLSRGQSQRFQMAANMQLDLEQPGDYVIAVRVNDEPIDHTNFRIIPAHSLPQR